MTTQYIHRKRLIQPETGSGSCVKMMKRGRTIWLAMSALWSAWMLLSPGALAQNAGSWNVNSNGTWSNTVNWLGGTVPNGTDDTANINFNITANRTLSLDVPVTVGAVNIYDPSGSSAYVISGNVLTFDVSSGNATLVFGNGSANGGNNTISSAVVLQDTLEIVLNDTTFRQAQTLSGIISSGVDGPGAGDVALIISNPTQVNGPTFSWNEIIVNGNNSFTGQVLVTSGTLRYETNNSAAGADGVGNETIVSGTGRVDLGGRDFRNANAEIFRISGHGAYNVGALVNGSTATGQAYINRLILDGDSTVNSQRRIDMRANTDVFENSVLEMNGHALTKFGAGDFVLADTTITNPGTINIYEGEFRFESTSQTATNPPLANGITFNIYYNPNPYDGLDPLNGTRTGADTYSGTISINDTAGNAVIESRLDFYNQNVTHTGVTINLNRGAIERNGRSGVGEFYTTTLDVTSVINLKGGGIEENYFNVNSGSNAYNSGTGAYDAPGALVIDGAIDNTTGDNAGSGISKRGNRELRLTNANTEFDGTFLVKQNTGRYLTPGFNATNGAMETQYASLTLSGANGALASASVIQLERFASLWLDNNAVNNNNRLNDSGVLDMRNGYLLLTTNAGAENTENFGHIQSNLGANKIFIDTRAGGRADNRIESIQIAEGSVLKIAYVDSTDTWGTGGGDNRISVADTSGLTLVGNATGTTDRAVILGMFGGVAPGVGAYTVGQRPLAAFEDGAARSNAGASLMTIETIGGVSYLRALTASEYDTSATAPAAGSNWMVTAGQGTIGNRANLENITSDLAINSLTISDTATDGNDAEYVIIGTGVTLTINSGIINFASYVRSNDASKGAVIGMGGMFNMNGQTAMIHSNNLWEDLDRNDPNYYAYITGNSAYIRGSIINANGLVKSGRNSLLLDTWNQFLAGSKVYVTDEGSLYARHSQSLNGISEVVVTGAGNFLLSGGVNITGVNVRALTGDSTYTLRAEDHHQTWGGDVILDFVDSGGVKEGQYARVSALANAALTIYGNIYVDAGASARATDSDYWDEPFLFSTNSGQAGILNLRGQVRDVETGALDRPVNSRGDTVTTIDRNHALRFQMTSHDEMIVNTFQQWNATGRLILERGYFRIQYDPTAGGLDGTGFLTDTARSRILANDYHTRAALSADSTTNTGTYHTHLFLTRDQQVFNWPYLYIHNNNGDGTITIGGENRSGTVYYGSAGNDVNTSIQFANQGGDRDLRILQVRGGTTVVNARFDDEGTSVNAGVSIIGPGTVRINGNAIGASDIERWNFIGGTGIWSNHLANNRFAVATAQVMLGGGTWILESDSVARTHSLSGNFRLLKGGSAIEAQNNIALTLGSGTATFRRDSGATLVFAESGTGAINLSGTTGLPTTDGARFDSWAVYGTSATDVTDWAARQGSTGVQAFTGYTDDTYTTGTHTRVTTDAALAGNTSTGSLKFATGADLDVGPGNRLIVESGGILVGSDVAGPVNISNGTITSAWSGGSRDLVLHNHGSGKTTISSAITDDGVNRVNFVHSGTGTTELTGENTYTGDTYINGGVLSISGDGQLGLVNGSISRLVLVNGGTGVSGSTLAFLTSAAPTGGATGTFVQSGGIVSGLTLANGGSGYTQGVYVNTPTATTTAGIWAIMDSGNLHLNGGTLNVTDNVTLNGARTIFLGANGGTLAVNAGSTLTINGYITSDASHVNTDNGYSTSDHVGNADQRYTDRNPDLGDLIIQGGGRVILSGNPDGGGVRAYLGNSIGGITWINEGVLQLNMAGSAANDWLGTNRSFTDGTIVGPNGTLELAATSSGDMYEWFTFQGKGYLDGGAIRTVGPAMTYDFSGQLFIEGNIYINNKNSSSIYLNESNGAMYGTGDIIRGGGGGEFRFYSNAPEWSGRLILGGGANRIYGNGKLPGATEIALSRNAYLGLGNTGVSENQFDDRLSDTLPIFTDGWNRLRMEAGGGVYSGTERIGVVTARWGVMGFEVDLGSAISGGAAQLTNDYAGWRFAELVRTNGSLLEFRNLDAGTGFATGSFGPGQLENKAVFQVDVEPLLHGTGDGSNGDTRIIAGFFGGTREEWFNETTTQRMSETIASREFMTAEQGVDPITGETVYYLRALSDKAGSTDFHVIRTSADVVNAGSLTILRDCDLDDSLNLRLKGLQTDAIGVNQLDGRRDQMVRLADSITINSFSISQEVFGNGANGNGETVSLMLGRDTTVTVTSGVLLFNSLGVQNRNGAALDIAANLDLRGYIQGGTFDFNGQQAILFNRNRWTFYNTSDALGVYRAEDGDNSHVRVNTTISNTGGNGLIKGGQSAIFLEGANTYTGDTTVVEGSLYVRGNRALGLSERVNVVADGQFILGQGTYVDGVDLYVGALIGNKLVLWSEQDGGYWGGNVILDNVDASGNAGGTQRNYLPRIGNASSSIFTIGGDLYGGGLDVNAHAINGAEGSVSRMFTTLTSAMGMLDFRGRIRDTSTGAVGAPVTTANQNDVLRMEVVASTNENTVQLWQSYDAAGRITLLRGNLRFAGDGNFYSDAAAAAMNPNNDMSGFHMGGRSIISNDGGLGTGDVTSQGNLSFLLANGGANFNIASWTVGGDTYDAANLTGNDNWGRGNNAGNSTIGGENRSGEVVFGTGSGTVTFTPYRTANSYRDLRLYAANGGEVTFRVNFVDGGDALLPLHTSLTKTGSGQVNLQGSSAGGSTVEGLHVLGGIISLEGYGTHLNRRVGAGASLVLGGGVLVMDGSEASFTENFGTLTVQQGGNGIAVAGNGAGNAGTISIGGASISRSAGGTVHFQSIAGGTIHFSNAAMTSVTRLGSYATFGMNVTGTAFATDWAATDASGNATAFSGYAVDTFAAGQHTDVVGAAQAAGTTGSVRFNSAAGTIESGTLTLNDGGVLLTSNHTGGTAIGAGVQVTTSGAAVDLLIHNYATSAVTIAGNITGSQNVVFSGVGTTVLTGANSYTGVTHLNGAAIVSVDDLARFGTASQMYINGGTLRYSGAAISSVVTREIVIGGNDATIDVSSATGIYYSKGVIRSEDDNIIAAYGANNPNNGGLTIVGLGTFQFGDRTAAAATQDLGGLVNTYTGLTIIGNGVDATRVDVQGMVNDNGQITPFGSTDGWADGTIVRNNSILEFSPKRGDGSRDQQVRVREWIQFGESASDDITLRMSTQRELSMDGMIHVVGNLLIISEAGGYADAGSTGSGTIYFGVNEGGLYGDGNITINGEGTVQFRSSMPNFTGNIDLQDGNLTVYGYGLPLGSGNSPIMMGLNGETGQVRLMHVAENGSNNTATAFDSGATDYTIARDIIVRNTAQDVRIGGGYYALNGTVRFTGSIQLGDGGEGPVPTVRLYYEDTEGLDASIYGVQQQTILEFSGGFSGAGTLLIDVNEGGSINDTPHDIYGIFHFTGDNSAWTGRLEIGGDGSTNLDTDDINIVRLGHANAIGTNEVRFRNNSILQLAGQDRTFTQNFLFIGGAGHHNTAHIENAGAADATVTFLSDLIDDQYQDIGIGLSDGTYWTDLGNVKGKLNVVKRGAGYTVMGASTGGGDQTDAFSTYSGTTTVEEGTLYAGSNNAFSAHSRYRVEDNAELSLYWDRASTGFDNTIGSLVGATLAQVDIRNSVLRLGGDGTRDADFAGMISGTGHLYKMGTGAQRLSGSNTNVGNVAVIGGSLIGGNNEAFGDGSNVIYLGGVPLNTVNPVDARVELLLDGTANAISQTVQMNGFDGNDEGITIIGTRAASGTYGFTASSMVVAYLNSAVNGSRGFFAESAGSSVLQFNGAITDSGFGATVTKIGTGTVELNTSNYYGPTVGQGAAINGGTIIRHGTISFSWSDSLGGSVVEMGDTHRALSQDAYLATTGSLITTDVGGTYDEDGNGAGGSGTGAFLNVKAEIDGVALSAADVGRRILVKDEGNDPERNGVYEIVSVDGSCGQMNLVRVSDFDEASEMLYGTSIGVTGGTQAGTRYFMGSASVDAVNGDGTDPVHWVQDIANADISLLASRAGLSVANAIDINDTNGTGATIIGGTFTTGTSTYGGNITLQHLDLPEVDNVREVTLTSASNTDAGDGQRGTIFSGIISEADAGDTLSVRITGPGTVTMTGANTYQGKTTVASGTLALHGDGSVSESAWLEVAGGAFFDTAAVSSGDYAYGGTVSGAGTIVTGAGKLVVGSDGGGGVLRPGMASNPADMGTAGDQIGSLSVVGNLELAGDAAGMTRLVLQLGATNAADFNDAGNFSTQMAAGTFNTWLTTQGDVYDAYTDGNHDRIDVSGTLTLNEGGQISLTNDMDSGYSFQFGDIFNLLDWTNLVNNGFNIGGTQHSGGLQGDLDLPTLGAGLHFDTTLFGSHGILVVVPEPGRALLLMVGLMSVIFRRRRKGAHQPS